MDAYSGLSIVFWKFGPAANNDPYGIPSLMAERQADQLQKFIEDEATRLIDAVWHISSGSEEKAWSPDISPGRPPVLHHWTERASLQPPLKAIITMVKEGYR